MSEKERKYQRLPSRRFFDTPLRRARPNSTPQTQNQKERLNGQTISVRGGLASIIKNDVAPITFSCKKTDVLRNNLTPNKDTRPTALRPQSTGKLKGSALVHWLVKNAPPKYLYLRPNQSDTQDEVEWSTSHFIPLHYFINVDEQASGFENALFEKGPLDAVALPMITSSGQPGNWSTCKVIAPAKKSHFFAISWSGGSRVGKPLVHRGLICFEIDEPEKFLKNLHDAIERRTKAEELLRYIHLINTVSLSEDYSLSQSTINQILSLALDDHERRQNKVWKRSSITALIEEVSADYSILMKKLVFESIEENLEYGMLTLESFRTTNGYLFLNYDQRNVRRLKTKELKRFQLTLLANSVLVASIIEVQGACIKLVKQTNVIHFNAAENTDFSPQKRLTSSKMISRVKLPTQSDHNSGRSMTLEELTAAITRMSNAMLRSVRDDFARKVAKQVHATLHDARIPSYDVTQSNRSAYMTTDLKRLLTRMDFMLQNAISEFLLTNFELYTSIVEEMACFDFRIQSLMEVWIYSKQNSNAKASFSSRNCSVFRLEVVASHENGQESSQNKDVKDNSGLKSKCLYDVPHDYEKVWSALDDVTPTIHKRPKLRFAYVISPNDYLDAFLSIFTIALSHVESLDLLERLVMDRIFWPTQCFIRCPDNDYTSLQQLRERICDAMSHAIVPTKRYLDLLEVYVPLLNLDPQDYVKSLYLQPTELKNDASSRAIDAGPDGDRDQSLGAPDIAKLSRSLRDHQMLEQNIQHEIPDSAICAGLFEIDVSKIRGLLAKKHREIILRLLEAHASSTNEAAKRILAKFDNVNSKLNTRPINIEDAYQLQDYLSNIQQIVVPLIENVQEIASNSEIFDEFQYTLSDEHLRTLWLLQAWPPKLAKTVVLAKDSLEEKLESIMKHERQV